MKLVLPPEPLDPGDPITVSITHQLRINGDDSWVKYQAGTRVRPGETSQDADTRLFTHVNTAILQMCEETAKTVMGHR